MKVCFILHSGSIELCLRHMQVYLPTIIDYVPDNIVMCIAAFLDACYIARRQDIDQQALDALKTASEKFWELQEVFRNTGVHPKSFMLPRQHVLFHYPRQIKDFGAPGGYVLQLLNHNTLPLLRNHGTDRTDMKHWVKCFKQING